MSVPARRHVPRHVVRVAPASAVRTCAWSAGVLVAVDHGVYVVTAAHAMGAPPAPGCVARAAWTALLVGGRLHASSADGLLVYHVVNPSPQALAEALDISATEVRAARAYVVQAPNGLRAPWSDTEWYVDLDGALVLTTDQSRPVGVRVRTSLVTWPDVCGLIRRGETSLSVRGPAVMLTSDGVAHASDAPASGAKIVGAWVGMGLDERLWDVTDRQRGVLVRGSLQ